MYTAYKELVELLDERGIGCRTNENQAVRFDLRGEVAVYRLHGGCQARDGSVSGRGTVADAGARRLSYRYDRNQRPR